jgi:hypothetical protein
MVAQSLNLGQVLSLGKTCGSVRSPCGSPRHGEGPQGATTARLDVTPASNALTHLVLLLLHRALLELVVGLTDPNVLYLIALQPQGRTTPTRRLASTCTERAKRRLVWGPRLRMSLLEDRGNFVESSRIRGEDVGWVVFGEEGQCGGGCGRCVFRCQMGR